MSAEGGSSASIEVDRALGRGRSDSVIDCLGKELSEATLPQAVALLAAVRGRTDSKLTELVTNCRGYDISWPMITALLGEPDASVVRKRYNTKGIQ